MRGDFSTTLPYHELSVTLRAQWPISYVGVTRVLGVQSPHVTAPVVDLFDNFPSLLAAFFFPLRFSVANVVSPHLLCSGAFRDAHFAPLGGEGRTRHAHKRR